MWRRGVGRTHLELLRVDDLVLDLLDSRLPHSSLRDRPQSVLHTVPEPLDLRHIELVLLDLASFGLLVSIDPRPHALVPPRGRQTDIVRLLLPPQLARDDERQGRSSAACASGTADAVRVGARGEGEVEVDDAGDVDKVDTAGDAVLSRRGLDVRLLALALLGEGRSDFGGLEAFDGRFGGGLGSDDCRRGELKIRKGRTQDGRVGPDPSAASSATSSTVSRSCPSSPLSSVAIR